MHCHGKIINFALLTISHHAVIYYYSVKACLVVFYSLPTVYTTIAMQKTAKITTIQRRKDEEKR